MNGGIKQGWGEETSYFLVTQWDELQLTCSLSCWRVWCWFSRQLLLVLLQRALMQIQEMEMRDLMSEAKTKPSSTQTKMAAGTSLVLYISVECPGTSWCSHSGIEIMCCLRSQAIWLLRKSVNTEPAGNVATILSIVDRPHDRPSLCCVCDEYHNDTCLCRTCYI